MGGFPPASRFGKFLVIRVGSFIEEVDSTMRLRLATGACLAIALSFSCTMAADAPKSGPQVGDNVPGPFNVLNVSGPQAGKTNCQV